MPLLNELGKDAYNKAFLDESETEERGVYDLATGFLKEEFAAKAAARAAYKAGVYLPPTRSPTPELDAPVPAADTGSALPEVTTAGTSGAAAPSRLRASTALADNGFFRPISHTSESFLNSYGGMRMG